jgi:hypothetical protein
MRSYFRGNDRAVTFNATPKPAGHRVRLAWRVEMNERFAGISQVAIGGLLQDRPAGCQVTLIGTNPPRHHAFPISRPLECYAGPTADDAGGGRTLMTSSVAVVNHKNRVPTHRPASMARTRIDHQC